MLRPLSVSTGIVLTCLSLLFVSASMAQTQGRIRVIESNDTFPQPEAVIEVRDSQNRPITGLDSTNFTILQDNRPIAPDDVQVQEKSGEALGPAVAFVLDASALLSASEVEAARTAAVGLLQAVPQANASNPELISLFVPSSSPEQVSQIADFRTFSHDHNAIINYLNTQLQLQPGTTRLYAVTNEAIISVSEKAKERGTPAYVVIFSDGRDSLTANDFERTLALAREHGVTFLAYGYGPKKDSDIGANRLRQLATETQGSYLDHPSADQAVKAYLDLVKATPQTSYNVNFTSPLAADDDVHSWQILVNVDGTEIQSQQLLFRATLAAQNLQPLSSVMGRYLMWAVPIAVAVSAMLTLLLMVWQQRSREDSRRLRNDLGEAPTRRSGSRL